MNPIATKNLGLIKAIHVGLNPPVNTKMIWFDDNTGIKIHKVYDVTTSTWIPLAGSGGGGSGAFIPLSGTVSGSDVTGDVYFAVDKGIKGHDQNGDETSNIIPSTTKVDTILAGIYGRGFLVQTLNADANLTIQSCYYDSTVSGRSQTTYGSPQSTTAMKLQTTYAGWDFVNIWQINPVVNNGYPTLRFTGLPAIQTGSIAIATKADWNAMISGNKYHLTNDIDFASDTTYLPLSLSNVYIDGRGFKIKNITMNANTGDIRGYIGVFGTLIESTIRHIGFDTINITGLTSNPIGNINKNACFATSITDCDIQKMYVTGTIALGNNKAVGDDTVILAGGFSVETQDTLIQNCYSIVNITPPGSPVGNFQLSGFVVYSAGKWNTNQNADIYTNIYSVGTLPSENSTSNNITRERVLIKTFLSDFDIEVEGEVVVTAQKFLYKTKVLFGEIASYTSDITWGLQDNDIPNWAAVKRIAKLIATQTTGSITGAYVPLAGTAVGSPITGDIQIIAGKSYKGMSGNHITIEKVGSNIEDGTQAHPFLIGSIADVESKLRNAAIGTYFRQIADLDYISIPNFAAMTFNAAEYDGNGYIITNMTQTTTQSAGFFTQNNQSAGNQVIKNVTITNSTFNGQNAGNGAGALIGTIRLVGTSIFSVKKCAAINCNVGVTAAPIAVAGLIGSCLSSPATALLNIEDCYVQGGTVGNSFFESGLLGVSTQPAITTLKNCYVATTVVAAGSPYRSAITSNGFGNPTIISCYYDSNLYTGSNISGLGTPETTTQMKTQSTYVGWDFASTWNILPSDYPRLVIVKLPAGGATNAMEIWADGNELDVIAKDLRAKFTASAEIDMPNNSGAIKYKRDLFDPTANPSSSVTDRSIPDIGQVRRMIQTGVAGENYERLTINSNGQTAFPLAHSPNNTLIKTKVFVDGIKQDPNADYTIYSSTMTWISTDYALQTTDVLEIYYSY